MVPVIWGCVTGLRPEALSGQTAVSSPAVTIAREVETGAVVRVRAPGVLVDLGRLVSNENDTLVVASEGQEWLVPTFQLERLEVQEKPVARWAFGGAVLGFGVAWASGQFFKRLAGASDGIGVSAPIGLVVGGAIGAGLGSTQTRWRVLFPLR